MASEKQNLDEPSMLSYKGPATESGRSQEFVCGGANSKAEIDDDEYHHCMDSLYF